MSASCDGRVAPSLRTCTESESRKVSSQDSVPEIIRRSKMVMITTACMRAVIWFRLSGQLSPREELAAIMEAS